MITKKIEFSETKALDSSQGIVEAFTNSMGVIDKDGDVIDPVAFNSSITKNLPIPVLAGHDQHQIVGKVISARPVHISDDEYKLYTLMQMNLETQAGKEAYSNVKGNYVREWSVGFNVGEEGIAYEGKGKEQVRRIKNLDWVEVSAVIRGASPQTATISAKADEQIAISNELEETAPTTEAEKADAVDTIRLQVEIELLKLKSKK